jgi:predicted ATPase
LGPARDQPGMRRFINGICVFSLDPESIAESVELTDCVPLISSGKGIGGVLDNLRDNHPDRFADLNVELARWLPEFSEIAPQVVGTGRKSFRVRTRSGKYDIPAAQLSHGTLFAIALITLAYLPAPPTLVCLEEPDRGIHPRLLRNVQDSIYRLAYPADFQERRDPVQVIATTHSPYFVNLFKDHPDEIVVANRDGLNVDFQRVSDQPGFHEIIHDSSLGDAWYTGVLGGVPSGS